ncbi:hypothetical protein DDV96_13960 [Marixanthomonas spongiae]|uniref:Uncharacterized protein n=1 Tax=Marixanthomonas spongiae TaxID=2174845 RepID=A0A2U0HWH0_9FLAO|nr:hypothetical protein DDV96_13960 [Marixanthomonas spongiae]
MQLLQGFTSIGITAEATIPVAKDKTIMPRTAIREFLYDLIGSLKSCKSQDNTLWVAENSFRSKPVPWLFFESK